MKKERQTRKIVNMKIYNNRKRKKEKKKKRKKERKKERKKDKNAY